MTDERVARRLAAILATDVVGYSRLMGRDESGTLARLREHRKERFEPALVRQGGRLVKLTGDGALAEFPSAVDALGAAIEFQQRMAEVNREQAEDTRIVFRIGLHLGDLIVDGEDLYGDGVNVAARLEGLGSARQVAGKGNDNAAADLFIRALQERPSALWIHRNLAAALYGAGRHDEAKASRDIMVQTYPGLTARKFREAMVFSPTALERIGQNLRSLGLPE